MSVELLRSMGDDLAIVNAARVSYAKESDWDIEKFAHPHVGYSVALRPADDGLINYLMKNRHGTPFEMVVFTFRIKCPIGVSREWMRHRISSFNEVSTRYVEMAPDFYVPRVEDVRAQVGKPGHYVFEPLEPVLAATITRRFERAYELAYQEYLILLEKGVAKELARNVLPLGLMTQFIWTVNLRSLLNFLSLRTHPTALLEIRTEAEQVEAFARAVVPAAMAAWDAHGRVAP